jgi:Na+-driven multidrug efflux pump
LGGFGIGETDMAKDMTKGSEARLILLFALPIMLGLVLQQLYNTVDSVVVGQYLGEAALSAVGTCSALTMFAVSFAAGLSNGAGIVLAQYFGAKKFHEMRKNPFNVTLSACGLEPCNNLARHSAGKAAALRAAVRARRNIGHGYVLF